MNILKNNSDKMAFRQRYGALIQKLRHLQQPNGGFSYWSGGNIAHQWGTTYAVDFLLEAKRLGYNVPADMLKKAIQHQYAAAENWTIKSTSSYRGYRHSYTLEQAYRLYVLAKAGKPNYASLNRLRLVPQLPTTSKWLLAHAFILIGERQTADLLIQSASTSVSPYRESNGTFGSHIRDQAMILRVVMARGDQLKAKRIVDDMAPYFKPDKHFKLSTQDIAQSLISFALFSGSLAHMEDSIAYDVAIVPQESVHKGRLAEQPKSYVLNNKQINNKSMQITNHGKAPLFSSISLTGTPMMDLSVAESQDLNLEIRYLSDDGKVIDPKIIRKGTDLIVEYTITHPGERAHYHNLALSAIFPSGWEIINKRLHDTFSFDAGSTYDHQDIRDDRVYTYFNLNKGDKKTFRFKLNATYQGHFWAPPTFCESMYDASIRSKSKGFWTDIK